MGQSIALKSSGSGQANWYSRVPVAGVISARLIASLTNGCSRAQCVVAEPLWVAMAVNVLLTPDKPFHKRIVPRLSFKSNIVALVFSLVGQHYHFTLKHSLKKTQLEPAVRQYTEKQLKAWNEKKSATAP